MNRLALALTVIVLMIAASVCSGRPAAAQAVQVVTSCGSTSPFPVPAAGTVALLTVDTTGRLCSSSSGGGGSSAITSWGGATLGAATGVGTIGSGNVISTNSLMYMNVSATPSIVTGTSFGLNVDTSASSEFATLFGQAIPCAASTPCSTGTGASNSTTLRVIPATNSHYQSTALEATHVAKASAGTLYGFYCQAITGATTGNCVALNQTTTPSAGTISGLLDVCTFLTASGCFLNRIPMGTSASTGITIVITTNASPFTYTTGATGFISVDYQ